MIRVKKSVVKPITNGKIKIRPLSENDLSYYRLWFSKHFTDGFISTLTTDQVDKMISKELAINTALIIDYADKPIGEITILIDKSIVLLDKTIKKPIFNLSILLHEECQELNGSDLIKLLLNLIIESKMKIGALYLFIDGYADKHKQSFIENNFKEIGKEATSSKLDKFFLKNGIENPYKAKDILVYNM